MCVAGRTTCNCGLPSASCLGVPSAQVPWAMLAAWVGPQGAAAAFAFPDGVTVNALMSLQKHGQSWSLRAVG